MTTFTGGSSPFNVGDATKKDKLDIPFDNTKAIQEGDSTAALDRVTLDDASAAVSPSGDLCLRNNGGEIEVSENGGAWRLLNTCKAHLHCHNSGTPSIQRDFNVATLTDLGVGLTQVNYTNAVANGDEGCGFSSIEVQGGGTSYVEDLQTTSMRIRTESSTGTDVDRNFQCAMFDHWEAS